MNKDLKDYLEAVALCAFDKRGGGRLHSLVLLVKGMKWRYVLLHFFLVTLMLNLPVMSAIAQLSPHELYSRLLADRFNELLIEAMPGGGSEISADNEALMAEFDLLMYEQGYGKTVVLPLLFFIFMVVAVLQIVFYLLAAFFLWLYRLNASRFSFRERFGIAVLASTFPVLGAALLGFWLPALHIIVFYFAVIFLIFAISLQFDKTEKKVALAPIQP